VRSLSNWSAPLSSISACMHGLGSATQAANAFCVTLTNAATVALFFFR
jgi:hypothetical protein